VIHRRSGLPALLACLCGFGCGGSGTSPDGVTARDAFVLDPLGAERTAFYVTLENHGPATDSLVAVRSPSAEHGSLHEMTLDAGMMRMRAVPGIEIAPGVVVRLEPGGLHGMLEGLSPAPGAGDTVWITLQFARGDSLVLHAPVRHPGDP
jgi:hypothetical protein